jgi:hypothetical protein
MGEGDATIADGTATFKKIVHTVSSRSKWLIPLWSDLTFERPKYWQSDQSLASRSNYEDQDGGPPAHLNWSVGSSLTRGFQDGHQDYHPAPPAWGAQVPDARASSSTQYSTQEIVYGQAYPYQHSSSHSPGTTGRNGQNELQNIAPDHSGPSWSLDHGVQDQDIEADDLQALSYPDLSILPDRAQDFFKITQLVQALPSTMEEADALAAQPKMSSLQDGLPVSRYFHHLDNGLYNQNTSEKQDWHDMSLDPAFAQLDSDSRIMSFGELEGHRNSAYKCANEEDPEIWGKFDIKYFYQTNPFEDPRRLSDEQEARLANLGVSGFAKSPCRTSCMYTEPRATQDQNIPPWRRNHNEEFSRNFPCPGPTCKHCFPVSGAPIQQYKSDDDTAYSANAATDMASKLEEHGSEDQRSICAPRSANPLNRSRATDFFVDDRWFTEEEAPFTKTFGVSPSSTTSNQTVSNDSTTSPASIGHAVNVRKRKKGYLGDDPKVDPVYYRRW